MRLNHLLITLVIVLIITWNCFATSDKVFHDDISGDERSSKIHSAKNDHTSNRTQKVKNFSNQIGLTIEKITDPYLFKTKEACSKGDLVECFKSQALSIISDFFDQPEYNLNQNIKIVRMSNNVDVKSNELFNEYTSTFRSDESEWNQLVQFVIRKTKSFFETTAIEVVVPSLLTSSENVIYTPRFLDEIADEIDTLENKKDTIFTRNRLKRVFIPLLIVLKLFKLKLLLFLPLILGLASFKKFLGFVALIIPGIIGFLRFYNPLSQSYTPPIYSPSGIGFLTKPYKENHEYHDHSNNYHPNYHTNHYDSSYQASDSTTGYANEMAYQGYRDYQK